MVAPKSTCFWRSLLRAVKIGVVVSGVSMVTACANAPWSQNLERSIAADPNLQDGSLFGNASPPSPEASPSPIDRPSPTPSPSPAPSPSRPSDRPTGTGTDGRSDSTSGGDELTAGAGTPQSFSDLDQAPVELQPYLQDLAELGALPLRSTNTGDGTPADRNAFQPNAAVTRRDYARWLVAANNLIYANQPARKIRLGVSTDQPAFQDVPTSDPDFAAIQGLANAGLIPSSLAGDATVTTFRPDAPLTREDLLRWKVPIDLRRSLPNATIDAVQQTWGFQDATRIDPQALRAVLADFQNGDLSNIRRAFGYTTLFQPQKTVTRAEAAAVLWFMGEQGNGLSAKDALQAESSPTTPSPSPSPFPSPSPSPGASTL